MKAYERVQLGAAQAESSNLHRNDRLVMRLDSVEGSRDIRRGRRAPEREHASSEGTHRAKRSKKDIVRTDCPRAAAERMHAVAAAVKKSNVPSDTIRDCGWLPTERRVAPKAVGSGE